MIWSKWTKHANKIVIWNDTGILFNTITSVITIITIKVNICIMCNERLNEQNTFGLRLWGFANNVCIIWPITSNISYHVKKCLEMKKSKSYRLEKSSSVGVDSCIIWLHLHVWDWHAHTYLWWWKWSPCQHGCGQSRDSGAAKSLGSRPPFPQSEKSRGRGQRRLHGARGPSDTIHIQYKRQRGTRKWK